jgi:glycerol-3-phosphate dehydrogenase
VPRLNRSDNAIAHFEPGGRIVFVIPWGERRDLSLVGTTDIDHTAGPEDVRISAEEVRYLLGVLKRLYPRSGELRPISAFSSLRPLVRDHTSSPARASRGHRIWNSAEGVLHVAGGKYTTYRAMSEEAVDQIAQEIAPQLVGIHKTAATPVLMAAGALAADHEVSEDDLSLLTELYGAHAPLVLRLLPDRDTHPLSRVQLARIAYAIEYEMARRLADLLFVSTYWGYEAPWTEKLLAPIATEMGARLGWDTDRTRQEIELALKIMGGWEL